MTIDEALKVLGLAHGATKHQVQRAHRKQAKLWHPDRFPNDEEMQEEALQRMKAINLALEVLEQAGFATGEPAQSKGHTRPGPPESTNEESVSAAGTADSIQPDGERPETIDAKRRILANETAAFWSDRRRVLAVCGLAMVVFWFGASRGRNSRVNPTTTTPAKNVLPSVERTVTSLPPKPRSALGPPADVGSSPVRDQLMEARRPAQATKSSDRRRRTFTLGSSEQDVAFAQGAPTRMSGDTWYFGDYPHQSSVSFHNGVVESWDSDPRSPLRLHPPYETAVLGSWPPAFTVGSPPAHVAAVQGTPSRLEPATWYYGNYPHQSHITFDDAGVSSWQVDSKAPLRVSHPGQLQEYAPAHEICQKAIAAAYGVKRSVDHAEAHRLFKEAAEQGNPAACVHVAWALAEGSGPIVGGQWNESDKWFEKAESNAQYLAFGRCADGMFAYAHLLLRKNAATRCTPAALEWLREAAAAKHIPSQIALAHLIGGTEKNPTVAPQRYLLYSAAAEQGAWEAVPWLAYFYMDGEVVPRNQEHAAQILEAAAMADVDSAYHVIAHALQSGQLVLASRKEGMNDPKMLAFQLLLEAWDINPNSSMNHAKCVADCYFDGMGTKADAAEGLRVMVEAARYSPYAQLEIAERISQGNKVKRNAETAATWFAKALVGFREAAERGNGDAAMKCAAFYEQGITVERDLRQAARWWTEAAQSPNLAVQRMALEKLRAYAVEPAAAAE